MKAYKGGKKENQQSETNPNRLRAIQQAEAKGNKVNLNESGRKYSDMLLQLIAPYHEDVPELDDLEYLLDIATVAWNIANMKKLLPPAGKIMLDEVRQSFADSKEDIQLLDKLIKAKAKTFPTEDIFIREFSIDPVKDGGYVTVTTVALQDFLSSELNEEEVEEDNFAPGYINRNGFSVLPKQPFFEWVQKTTGTTFLPAEINESTVYLLEEKQSNEEITEWLKENFDKVFQKELEAWIADEKKWPRNRTYQVFTNWFDVKFHSMIYDLEDYPVDKDME